VVFRSPAAILCGHADSFTVKKLFPTFAKIVSAHVKGTRYNIHVDPADGLLYGGGPGVQLTWMDAKIGDWVVTAAHGKARRDQCAVDQRTGNHGGVCAKVRILR